jgi:DNA protecting protein DprA
LDEPAEAWAGAARLNGEVRRWLGEVPRLSALGQRVLERAAQAEMQIAFKDDPAYPERLREVEDAPPLLFFCGNPGGPRRRVAMVGSRRPDPGFASYARTFAMEVAAHGVTIVSGGAHGIDQACHEGALKAGGETWAFMGSALDELDPPQARLKAEIVGKGGVLFTELPPGVRATASSFPRRNRLISGASDVVVVLRAGIRSGSLHTAKAAQKQGRPVLAIPGEAKNEAAAGCNALIRAGRARLCSEPHDVIYALTGKKLEPRSAKSAAAADTDGLTQEAQVAYNLLGPAPVSFEQLLDCKALSSARLTAALVELELFGLVIQHPGKVYERT